MILPFRLYTVSTTITNKVRQPVLRGKTRGNKSLQSNQPAAKIQDSGCLFILVLQEQMCEILWLS